MVANLRRFKGKMAENNYTQRKLAEDLGLTEQAVGIKINSERYEFTLSESVAIKKLWGLTDQEYLDIFIHFE